VGVDLLHADRRTKGGTDRHDEANSRFSRFCYNALISPKKFVLVRVNMRNHFTLYEVQLVLCDTVYEEARGPSGVRERAVSTENMRQICTLSRRVRPAIWLNQPPISMGTGGKVAGAWSWPLTSHL
jgi:hypothetical protein